MWDLGAHEGPVAPLEQPVFRRVEEVQEVGMDGTSSPTSRGCRVLEVVPPYLRAVYLNRPATRNGRSSSARCPEHIITLWLGDYR